MNTYFHPCKSDYSVLRYIISFSPKKSIKSGGTTTRHHHFYYSTQYSKGTHFHVICPSITFYSSPLKYGMAADEYFIMYMINDPCNHTPCIPFRLDSPHPFLTQTHHYTGAPLNSICIIYIDTYHNF